MQLENNRYTVLKGVDILKRSFLINKVLWSAIYSLMVSQFVSFTAVEAKADFTLDSHGWVTLESYIHGRKDEQDLNRSHRSEFTGIVDIYNYKAFTFTFLLGNATDIARQPDSTYYMDRIIYTYTYGGRLDLGPWVIRGDYHHDCIHLIDRPELNGSTWWNSYLIRMGTRGAFYLYLPEGYNSREEGLLGPFDARVGFAAYRKPGNTIADGQNHNYQYEFSNLIRYQFAGNQKWIGFVDLHQRLWMTWDSTYEYKGEFTLNVMLKGKMHYMGLYYEYHFYDTYIKDREQRLGSLGLRILF